MNKCKPIIYIILMLAMIQLAWGGTCEISEDNITFATINSTRDLGCSDTTSDIAIVNKLDCGTDYTVRCKNSTTGWGYEEFTTEDCGEDEPMAALAITIFILLISGTLFWLALRKEVLHPNKYTDLIFKRCCLVIGIYLMILNSAIMATIAVDAGLALEQEMFFYMQTIGWLGYPAIIFLMLTTTINIMVQWKADKKKKRTGDEDE